MKRTAIVAALLLMGTLLFAGPQFRVAGNAATPLEELPQTAREWDRALWPGERTMMGWQWEFLLDRFGLGMHYAVRLYETADDSDPFVVDWKGDFFFSYHLLGSGAFIDPFVEFGWGNAGSTIVDSVDDYDYPDWEEEVYERNATALALYTYAAAGVALNLNGLLLGARLAYHPEYAQSPVPEAGIDRYDLAELELGLFGGIALGGRDRRGGRGWW